LSKFLTRLFLGLLLIVGAGASAKSDSTFTFTNNGHYSVKVRLFSHTGNREWPGGSRWYDLNSSAPQDIRIACQVGEYVCYGAAYDANNDPRWGRGLNNDQPCTDCCLTCGQSHAWTLNDTRQLVCAKCNNNACRCGYGTRESLCANDRGDNPRATCNTL